MENNNVNLSCPLPIKDYPKVLLAHGSGGTLMNELIEGVFKHKFNNKELNKSHDSSIVNVNNQKIAMTTDSYVVHPLIFPGGNIGSMAIHGTINDLAMSGAKPLAVSVGFILEEGLDMELLIFIVDSMNKAAKEVGVEIITGDTKVVDKGKGDGLYINTTGIGIVEHNLCIEPSSISDGDAIILSGDIGRHGIAIMAVREGLEFESKIESDSAPIHDVVNKLLESNIKIHCMRDLTRGGLASALVEIASKSKKRISVTEDMIPVREDVKGACEILGFDPMYVANEGRFIVFVSKDDVSKTLEILKSFSVSDNAQCIGSVSMEKPGLVTLKSCIGTERIIDMLSGEQLPRIC